MMNRSLILFLRLTKPLYLLVGGMLYALGTGIANYLGEPINWGLFWLGLLWVFMVQLSGHYLNDYFNLRPKLENGHQSPFTAGSGTLGPGGLARQTALWAASVTLTVGASLTVLLIRDVDFTPPTMFVMVALVVGMLLYTTPPFQLAVSGYGELLVSILIVNLLPSFAYLLQTGKIHRLLAMSTFPLVALHLAMVISYGLADFARDLKYENQTLLVRMGWRDAMTLHNLLILGAYFILALAGTFGLPLRITLPALLPMPLGAFQVWQMSRIASGAKPNWRALHLTAVSVFAATAYLLTYGFWTR